MATMLTVLTTLPNVGVNPVQPLETQRLIIRPLLYPTDLEAYRTIRSQPAAMTSSRTGLPDATLQETEAKLKRLQRPYRDSHVYFGIFLKSADHDTEGVLIGDGGVHKFSDTETGWPEFGYKLKQEYWGRGFATEFARAFMQFWRQLPRLERQVQVARNSLSGNEQVVHRSTTQPTCRVLEQIVAWTKVDNIASQRVLQKVGFERFEGLDNGMVNWRKTFPGR